MRGTVNDIINDFVGYRNVAAGTLLDDCESLMNKAHNERFIGGDEAPYKWLRQHPTYGWERLVYRLLEDEDGRLVKPNGRVCAEVWAKASEGWK